MVNICIGSLWVTPRPKSGSCVSTGGPKGANPRSRSGGATSSKERSSGCALLEQPCRDKRPKVREIQVRHQVKHQGRCFKGSSEGRHTETIITKKLANLITQTTALSNSVKLSHAVLGHPRWMGHGGEVWQNVVHWRREWKPLQYSCLENPMNSMKRQNDRILKEKLSRLVGTHLLQISGEITPERRKGWSQRKNNTQLWMWLVMEARSDAVKSNIA